MNPTCEFGGRRYENGSPKGFMAGKGCKNPDFQHSGVPSLLAGSLTNCCLENGGFKGTSLSSMICNFLQELVLSKVNRKYRGKGELPGSTCHAYKALKWPV